MECKKMHGMNINKILKYMTLLLQQITVMGINFYGIF